MTQPKVGMLTWKQWVGKAGKNAASYHDIDLHLA